MQQLLNVGKTLLMIKKMLDGVSTEEVDMLNSILCTIEGLNLV